MSDWQNVMRAEHFQSGSCEVIDIEGVNVAVYCIDGTFYAIADECTHAHIELSIGEVDGHEVVCPLHGARFCLKSGKAMTPPAYEDLECYPVRVEDGMVQVKGID
jgi:3-phenylpropionate/trans-cinnamate dioxygenase ferredoxin subunit